MEEKQNQAAATANHEHRELMLAAKARSPKEAAELLAEYPVAVIAAVLQELAPAQTQDVLGELPGGLLDGVMHAVSAEIAAQWQTNGRFPEGTIGRMMVPPRAVFRPDMSVRDTVEQLRPLVRTAFITYGYVTDETGRLLGIITMRDLLFADDHVPLESVMLRNAFTLKPDVPLADAMKLVLDRHYPVYPVCDEHGKLLGLVRGQTMFEEQAFEITAQVGSMVGVEKEERLATPLKRTYTALNGTYVQTTSGTTAIAATLNVAGVALAGFEDRTPEISDYDDETDEQRLARRKARWTPSCAACCRWSCGNCTATWASRSCTSPTTRRRRSP